jgi:hypothetical protein
MKKPELRLISKTTEHDLFDDLDQLRVTPAEAAELERARLDRLRREKERQRQLGSDDLNADRAPTQSKPVRSRLPRAAAPFVRIWPTRWADSRLYPAHTRLHHLLIHLSREGRDQVKLTVAVAEMAKISRWHRSRHARHLERLGLVRIEHHNPGLLVLTVLSDPIVRDSR